ncbi:PAS domain-containing protein [Oscillatoria sp. FACHB-1407]|uniref:PAS domain-containing protein n=1 Tax=Oscillatoria sp. FACHB-1407 TaxID=2692847 RepID=UPI00168895CA|nr:PAS domain-containing protein [Oscillatoria sp. FACHB-1407]MBD2461861.1 PAS domain-containing protein [Oscillatoria sp. FACHB-1407]
MASSSNNTVEQIATLQAQNADLQRQVQELKAALADSQARHRVAETRLSSIRNNAGAAITSFRVYRDREWDYEYRSVGAETIFGYTSQEFELDPNLWKSRVFAEDVDRVIAPAIARIFAGESFQMEYRFHHKDGSLRWICDTLISQPDDETDSWFVTAIALDVSDRKQTETELQHNRDFIERVMDGSPQLLYIFDLVEQRNLYINRQITTMLGYIPAEIQAWGSLVFRDCVHPDDLPRVQQSMQGWSNIPDGQYLEIDYRMRHKDGSWRWLRSRDVVFERDEAGQPTKILGTAVDISDRKQLELALQLSEEQLRQIIENIPDIFFLKDFKTREVIYINSAYETFSGRSRRAAYQNNDIWLETIHPDDQAFVLAKYQQAKQGTTFFNDEYRRIRPDGSICWVWDRTFPIHDDQGNIYRFAGVVRDITERKQLELALQASEAKLQDILNSAIAAICSLRVYETGDYDYEYMSSGCEAVFGYTKDEFFADKNLWRSRVFPEDLCRVLPPEQITQEITDTVAYRFYRKDGSLRWISNHIKIRRDDTTHTWLVTIVDIDIHDRKTAEIALQQSETKLSNVLNSAGAAITQFRLFADMHWQYEFYSPGSEAIFGYSVEELMHGNIWLSCVHPEDARNVHLPALEQMLAEKSVTIEFRFRQKDGSWRWISETATSRRDDAADCWFVTCVATDISDRKALEFALQVSETKLNDILNSAPAAITSMRQLADQTWITDYRSCGYEQVFGYTGQELEANPGFWLSRVIPEDRGRVITSTTNLKALEPNQATEYRFQHRDGSLRWIAATQAIRWDERAECTVVTIIETDISDRKFAEQALQKAEESYSLATRAAKVGVWEWNLRTNDFYLDPTIKGLLGYTDDEIPNDIEYWATFVHPDDRDAVMVSVQDHLDGKTSEYAYEHRMLHKDGSIVWILARGQVLRDEQGNPERMVGVDMDVSHLKQAEVALQQSEERFREIAQTVSQAFFVHSAATGEYIYISPAYERIWGYSCDTLYQNQKFWLDTVHPDDRPQVLASVAHQCEGNSVQREYRIIRPDGDIRWISAQITLIRDEAGTPLRFIGLAEDISHRKRAEEALRQSEQIFRQAFETSAFGISIRSPEGKYLRVNQTLCQILGYTDVELLQLTYRDVTHPDDLAIAPQQTINKLVTGEIPYYRLEKRFLHKQGHIVWGLISMSVVRDLQQQPLYFVTQVQDITARKATELENLKLRERLQFLIAKTPAAIFTCKVEDDYGATFMSDNIQSILGYKAQEFVQNSEFWMSHVHPDDTSTILAGLDPLFEHGFHTHEYRFLHQDGTYRWMRNGLNLVRDANGKPIEMVGYFIDITDRKQAEDALRLSEELFRQIIENISDVFFLKDAQTGALIYINSAYETVYGRSCQSLYDDPGSWLESIHPDDSAYIQAKYQQELVGQTLFDDEYRLVRADGSIRWIWDRTFPIHDKQGKVYRFAGVTRDITERKRLELALQASETKLNDILNSAIAAISSFRVFANRDWEYEYWSDGCEGIYGYTSQEFMADNHLWLSRIHPDDIEKVILPKYQEIFNESTFLIEFRSYHKDGSLRWVTGSFTSRRDDKNDCWVVTVVNIDITDRKYAEIALRQSQEELRLITNSLPACIAYIDTDRRYRFVNQTYNEWFCLSPEEILGKQIAEVIGEAAYTLAQPYIDQVFTGKTVEYEIEFPYPSGNRYVNAMLVPRIDHITTEVQGYYALVTDISDRKQFEKQLQRSLREKEILLTEIHHRVKNNLQVISSLLDLQANRSQDLHLKMALKISQDRVLSMALVHEALYRLEQFAAMNFAAYAEELIRHLFNTYRSSERRVINHINIDSSINISLDQAVPCGLILNELVTNVMKYGCSDVNTTNLYVSLQRIANTKVQLTVGNEGNTLPTDFNIKRDVSIGLTLVQVLTDQLSGRFEIERGDRTLFKVIFPLDTISR